MLLFSVLAAYSQRSMASHKIIIKIMHTAAVSFENDSSITFDLPRGTGADADTETKVHVQRKLRYSSVATRNVQRKLTVQLRSSGSSQEGYELSLGNDSKPTETITLTEDAQDFLADMKGTSRMYESIVLRYSLSETGIAPALTQDQEVLTVNFTLIDI